MRHMIEKPKIIYDIPEMKAHPFFSGISDINIAEYVLRDRFRFEKAGLTVEIIDPEGVCNTVIVDERGELLA